MPRRISHYPRRDGPLPAGARWVGRPTSWGNPHEVGMCTRCTVMSVDMLLTVYHTRSEAIELYRSEVLPHLDLEPLRSADALACACKMSDSCHVDALLEALSKS